MTKNELRINKFALKDIEMAIDYYNEIKNGLGDEFWMETKAKLEQIEQNLMLFQIIKDETRRANLKRFPFGIYFVFSNYIISVFGIIHYSRSPKIWQNRI